LSGRRISVLIAAYNLGRYLPETLDSVLAQTHDEREIIVVDDGSTDGTADVLQPYLPHIRYVRQENAGLGEARNHGLRFVGGDYVALLDADDTWIPDKLAIQLEIARRRPQCGLITCDGIEFAGAETLRQNLFPPYVLDLLAASPSGEVVGRTHRAMIKVPAIGCPAQTLIPRAVIERLGPFADGGAQDYDYYLRIAQHYRVVFHRHRLARWRYRPDSMSGPRERRDLVWALYRLPVLGAHAARCADPQDRRVVAETIDQVMQDVMAALMPGATTRPAG
jgi:glycosyltransferase involved in cell wall biosynthesis